MPESTVTHLSIGDVLATLRDEFPDITISKIRFLESQGLIDPERTPSGYRKFYDADVARLRWILHQQKEHFLPLKVIKGRLEQLELGDGSFADELSDTPPAEEAARAGAAGGDREDDHEDGHGGDRDLPAGVASERGAGSARGEARAGPRRPTKARVEKAAKRRTSGPPPLPLDDGRADDLAPDPSGVSLTRQELAKAAGLSDDALAELEAFGLLFPAREAGGRVLFDEDGLAVARLAAGFARRGIEARHLRMYRTFAEREMVLFQQVLLSVLRQRNPEARGRAQEELAELARLGRGLRTAYLRQAARDLLAE